MSAMLGRGYRRVASSLACPKVSATVTRSAPALSMLVAQVCLNMWGHKRGSLAFQAYFFTARQAAEGLKCSEGSLPGKSHSDRIPFRSRSSNHQLVNLGNTERWNIPLHHHPGIGFEVVVRREYPCHPFECLAQLGRKGTLQAFHKNCPRGQNSLQKRLLPSLRVALLGRLFLKKSRFMLENPFDHRSQSLTEEPNQILPDFGFCRWRYRGSHLYCSFLQT